jgi:Uma2 family endonuclease
MAEIQLLPTPGTDSYTLADLDAWPESLLVELHQGAIVVNPPPTGAHAVIVNAVADWLKARRNPATVLASGVGIAFDTTPGDGFVPDVAVVAPGAEIDPGATWQRPERFELVVEVLSPSTRDRDLGHKREVYAGAGLAYWIVDLEARAVMSINDTTGLDPQGLAVTLWPREEV